VIELPVIWIVILNAGGWAFIQISLAWGLTRLPAGWFSLRGSAGSTRLYEWTGIRRWKDLLPDGANWFAGGFPKARLGGKDVDYYRRFIRETRRGETCHWIAIACAPVFFLWNPWWGDLVIAAYAIAANLPCILVQRYNRIRFSRALARLEAGISAAP
jgi:glycosyl-4,4'-diaponeurosporenoate acyltransferase